MSTPDDDRRPDDGRGDERGSEHDADLDPESGADRGTAHDAERAADRDPDDIVAERFADAEEARARGRASLGWAVSGFVVFVALVIAGWGIGSLIADRDVLPMGLSLWAGPAAVVVSAQIVASAARRAVVIRWTDPTHFDVVNAITGGLLAVLAQAVIVAIFAAFGGEYGFGEAILTVGLGHVTSVFGIVVVAAGSATVLALQAMAGRYPPGGDE